MLSHSQKMLNNDQNKKKMDIVVGVYYIENMNIKYILDKNIIFYYNIDISWKIQHFSRNIFTQKIGYDNTYNFIYLYNYLKYLLF